MGQVIGEFLPLALGVAISPVPVIAVILMLFSERAKQNSLAFLAGWVVGIVAAMTDPHRRGVDAGSRQRRERTSDTSSWIKLVMGLLLVVAAAVSGGSARSPARNRRCRDG